MADLALPLQLVEGGGHLLRLHQGVGAVDQQDVQVVGAQALQDAVCGGQDVLPGGIVEALPDAALGLQDQVLPAEGGVALQRCAEVLLAGAAAVDVGVVEKVRAVVQRGVDEPAQGGAVQLAQPHTAHGYGGHHPAGTA